MKYTVNDGFPYYIELVGNNDYKALFQSEENIKLLETLTETQASYRYAPGKWSIKQIMGHIIDHERIMVYRVLRFSRKDTTLLPGYDQDLYVDTGGFDELPFSQILSDFKNVRRATNSFIESLTPEKLALTGTAWKYELTITDFLKSIIGHEYHHFEVLKQKYLS
jgi:uncharacterized damage-inducible protein DinB